MVREVFAPPEDVFVAGELNEEALGPEVPTLALLLCGKVAVRAGQSCSVRSAPCAAC